MQEANAILNDFNNSTKELVQKLSEFSADVFNQKPSAETWSAADVAEHLLLIDNGSIFVLHGKTKPTERNPEEKIQRIKSALLNFDKKLSAGGPIKPSDKPKEQIDIIEKIKFSRQTFSGIIGVKDLTETCLGFSHAIFGELTRMEWVYFIIFHTERYLQQLDRINKGIIK